MNMYPGKWYHSAGANDVYFTLTDYTTNGMYYVIEGTYISFSKLYRAWIYTGRFHINTEHPLREYPEGELKYKAYKLENL